MLKKNSSLFSLYTYVAYNNTNDYVITLSRHIWLRIVSDCGPNPIEPNSLFKDIAIKEFENLLGWKKIL